MLRSNDKDISRNPWWWIPTLYFVEGLPNAIVVTVSIVLYKDYGVSNKDITFYTGLFYLPWVLKPLWSPVVDIVETRRRWIWQTQFVLGAILIALALSLTTKAFFPLSLVLFWLLALCSATHDIAADGFYMLALDGKQQSFFVGVRNTLYRAASLFIKSPFYFFLAALQSRSSTTHGWIVMFAVIGGLLACMGAYHSLMLPRPAKDQAQHDKTLKTFTTADFISPFASFFQKQKIVILLLFLLFYRFGESQLMPLVQPFLLDPRAAGGLELSKESLSFVNGVGVVGLMLGGIIGGIIVSRRGLRACIWPMVFVMHLPDAVFIYLAYAQPQNLQVISGSIALEQFGYGFGFTAYMLYMIYIARGKNQTAHYAICTGFMALGLMLPGMFSGKLQESLGYAHFFIWVLLATIPGFIVTALIPLEAGFGKKHEAD